MTDRRIDYSNQASPFLFPSDILQRYHLAFPARQLLIPSTQSRLNAFPYIIVRGSTMAVSKERITVYNLADLKNTSDDAIPNYLNSLKFSQSHALTDVRLALGYSAFLLAAACFLWDYKLGFESTKYYTAGAVAVYTILNSALTLWIWLKEKGIIYVGTAPDGETVRILVSF